MNQPQQYGTGLAWGAGQQAPAYSGGAFQAQQPTNLPMQQAMPSQMPQSQMYQQELYSGSSVDTSAFNPVIYDQYTFTDNSHLVSKVPNSPISPFVEPVGSGCPKGHISKVLTSEEERAGIQRSLPMELRESSKIIPPTMQGTDEVVSAKIKIPKALVMKEAKKQLGLKDEPKVRAPKAIPISKKADIETLRLKFKDKEPISLKNDEIATIDIALKKYAVSDSKSKSSKKSSEAKVKSDKNKPSLKANMSQFDEPFRKHMPAKHLVKLDVEPSVPLKAEPESKPKKPKTKPKAPKKAEPKPSKHKK